MKVPGSSSLPLQTTNLSHVLMRRDHLPLSVRRETRSAHAAQVGRGNHCGNPVRVLQRVAKSDAAAGGQPCIEVSAHLGRFLHEDGLLRGHRRPFLIDHANALAPTRVGRRLASSRRSKLP